MKGFTQNKHREKVHATAKTQMTLLHAKGGQRKLKNRIGTQRNSSVVYALALVAVFQTCKKIGKSYFRWWLEMLLLLLLLLSWAEFFDQYPLGIGILYQIVRKFSRHSVISSTVLKHCYYNRMLQVGIGNATRCYFIGRTLLHQTTHVYNLWRNDGELL